MNKFYFTVILSILSFTSIAETRDENEIVSADKEDPVMVSAIKEARSTLNGFLDRDVSNIPNVSDYLQYVWPNGRVVGKKAGKILDCRCN